MAGDAAQMLGEVAKGIISALPATQSHASDLIYFRLFKHGIHTLNP